MAASSTLGDVKFQKPFTLVAMAGMLVLNSPV